MAQANQTNNSGNFEIVWLDSNVDKSRKDSDTKSLIRRMIRGRLYLFDKSDPCIDYIFDRPDNQRIIFIISNALGPKVIDTIHELNQIHTIYIYCRSEEIARSWSKPYKKISHILTRDQDLLRQMCEDIGISNNIDDLSLSIFHLEDKQNSIQNLSEDSVKFMWYQSVLMVLRLMAKYYNSKTEMIEECRRSYADDQVELRKINDFEKDYVSTKALWWYTSDSFVYRLLNTALRTQNIEIIFKFRFFINDLHNQIHRLYVHYVSTHPSHGDNPLTVYRGQRMPIGELELLKKNIGQLISMNSFLSATTIRYLAEVFADTEDQINEPSPLQSVLFIVEIRDISKDTTPFAFIEDYSCFAGEEEVLFTIGAIFKVKSVEKDQKNTWHIHLESNKQQNRDCEEFFNYMTKQIGSDPSPSTLGWFLYRMSDFNKAERYIDFLIKHLPSNDKEVANAYNLLGLIHKDLKHYQDSIEYYEKALMIYTRLNCPDSSQIVAIHCNLGLAYLAIEDERNADANQLEAESKLLNSAKKDDPILLALTISLRAKIQIFHRDYRLAYDNIKKAHEKKKSRLSVDHPSMASSWNDMGIVQENLGDLTEALKCFNHSLAIRRKTLPPKHLDMAECHENIGRILKKRQEYTLASRQFELASEIEMNNIRQ